MEPGGRGRKGHFSLVFLDLHELLMGNIILEQVIKVFSKLDFILLIKLHLEFLASCSHVRRENSHQGGAYQSE
jgi:hypothetical protein